MDFEEHVAKSRLAAAGIPVPRGHLVTGPQEAARAAVELGPVVVKAQVPAGRRGKAGGVRPADGPQAAAEAARAILELTIDGYRVERLLVEERAVIDRELYAAVLNDAESRGPLLVCSPDGGMDIEEVAARDPGRVHRTPLDVRTGLSGAKARAIADRLDLGAAAEPVARALEGLYRAYREADAELLEVNPLVVCADGRVMALDGKLSVDDSALPRQAGLAELGSPERLTGLEERARELGLKYIELDGDVGVLANGAGLTMTTMDVIVREGGVPANFLEIGGDAYTRATPALELVLANPRVRSLVVNFCGAFARTDVMTGGVIDALEALRPAQPVFFSVRGTGSAQAVELLRERLGVDPYPSMDEAIRAAVAAAREEGGR